MKLAFDSWSVLSLIISIPLLAVVVDSTLVLIPIAVIISLYWQFHHKYLLGIEVETTRIIKLKDLQLEYGGIVTGAIGMGKYTLRFHIIHYLKSLGYQIIDIDLKGENSKIIGDNKSLVPGKNFSINLFNQHLDPVQLKMVLDMFVKDLSPPQVALLQQVINSVRDEKMNLQKFFDNILIQGMENTILGIGSSQTPMALLYKCDILQQQLGMLFNTKFSNVNFEIKEDLFFDFSYLASKLPYPLLADVVNFILYYFVLLQPEREKTAIFIDEAQVLTTQNKLSAIEIIITTLRSRNIPMFLFATRSDYFPKLVLDSANIMQFHKHDTTVHGYSKAPTLKPFRMTYSSPKIARPKTIDVFRFTKNLSTDFIRTHPSQHLKVLELDPLFIRERLLLLILSEHLVLHPFKSQLAYEKNWKDKLPTWLERKSIKESKELVSSYLVTHRDKIIQEVPPVELSRYYLSMKRMVISISEVILAKSSLKSKV